METLDHSGENRDEGLGGRMTLMHGAQEKGGVQRVEGRCSFAEVSSHTLFFL